MLENQTDQREVFILISLLFITLFQRARRARVILLQRMISRRIQRRRRAAFCQFLTIFAWRQPQRPKRVAWVLPRPQYWFETLLHSNALNMWWKENFRVSRETFNFICATVVPVIQRQDTILRAAIPLEKRAAVGLWRLATGDSYRSVESRSDLYSQDFSKSRHRGFLRARGKIFNRSHVLKRFQN